jgi:hypothetical protein
MGPKGELDTKRNWSLTVGRKVKSTQMEVVTSSSQNFLLPYFLVSVLGGLGMARPHVTDRGTASSYGVECSRCVGLTTPQPFVSR